MHCAAPPSIPSREGLDQQSIGLEALQDQAELKLQALTINLAELQARMTRLDALGNTSRRWRISATGV